MSFEELMDPCPPVEHPVARYALDLGPLPDAALERYPVLALAPVLLPALEGELDGECVIDAVNRRMVHHPGCDCIRPEDGAVDCAGTA